MTTDQKPQTADEQAIERAVMHGDLSPLTEAQRRQHYREVCERLHLEWRTAPFAYLKLNGKLQLYALKGATDQLRRLNGVSIYRLDRELVENLYVVTAYVRDKDGREDSDLGAADMTGLRGDAAVNAMLKASTKAKRRATLSICGLGWLDETEVESIPGAQVLPPPQGTDDPAPPANDTEPELLPANHDLWERRGRMPDGSLRQGLNMYLARAIHLGIDIHVLAHHLGIERPIAPGKLTEPEIVLFREALRDQILAADTRAKTPA